MHCRFFNSLPLPLLFNVKVLVQSQLHLQHVGFLSKVIALRGNILFTKCAIYSLLLVLALQLCVEKESVGLQSSRCNEGAAQTWITNAAVSMRLIFQ